MGELVAFRSTRSAARSPLNPSESAEILFFTGVRFARFEDYVERPKTRRRRREPARQEPQHDRTSC
jgi:hypothetical protein